MNYRWIKVQIKNQIQFFFYHKQKNGFSLYNAFIDLYVDPKTKVVLSLIDSIILIIFYSSLTDFYYLGPYLLNLISSIKFVCNSKEITTKIINENFLDINTMICDLIGFFNGFTRALCQDYNCYLGCDAIYNERCFLHLRKNCNDSILVMCRERSGSNDYFQLKSLEQIKPKQKDKINSDLEEKIEVKNKNILMFLKFKKNEKKKEYLTFDYKNYKDNKNNYDKNENNYHMKNITNQKLDYSIVTNNLDLPSESQIIENDDESINNNFPNENENDQIIEVFDFINNITKKNDEPDINYNNETDINNYKKNSQLSKSYNYKKTSSFNNENNYITFKHQKSNEIKLYDFENKYQLNNNNNTNNFIKSVTQKNMKLIQNIDFGDLENNDNNDSNLEINEHQNFNYENLMKETLMNNFNKINNNYIDEEISQVFNKRDNFNVINNFNFNNNWNNNNNYNINNNIYYPTQEINTENNIFINTNSQQIVPYIPQLNFNNNLNNPQINLQSNQFSQNDLSFLKGYSKVDNSKEDFIKLNKTNPEIISEVKEKIYYYHALSKDGNYKVLNISLKGYIGINIKPPNIINNKEFYINFFTEKWKDYNYFINRELNKKLEQITENIYKISLLKQKNAIKLITYSINKNIMNQINLIQTKVKIINNTLIYKFNYTYKSYETVKSIEIILEYKNNYQINNQISTDGKIIFNNNVKSNIIYKHFIKEGKILFPINDINKFIKSINIQIILKDTILTDMNCKISFSNSVNQSQESLPNKKISLLSFRYE